MRLCMLRFLGIVLAVDLASGGVGPENFRGVVRDAAGGGLPGASVLVQRWEWDRSTKRPRLVSTPPVQTDDEGGFSVYLPPGLYDVFVSYIAMEPVAVKVEIKPVTPTNLDCRLELSPLAPTAGPLEVAPEQPRSSVLEPPPSSCVARGP
jgi:hypothetical protein